MAYELNEDSLAVLAASGLTETKEAAPTEEVESQEPVVDAAIDADLPESDEVGTDADAGTEAPSSDSEETVEGDEWITDDVRELAANYELSDEELQQFGSPEEFQRAAILFDKRAFAAPKQDPPPTQATETKTTDDLPPAFDIEALKAKNYEDDVIAAFERSNALREALLKERERGTSLEAKVSQIVESHERAAAKAHYDAFHDIADTFEEDMFGRSLKDGRPAKLSDAQVTNRTKLGEALQTVADGLARQAELKGAEFQPPSMKVLMQRAKFLAFGDKLLEQTKRQVTESAQRQSTRRRPAAAASRTTRSGLEASHRNNQPPPSESELVSMILGDPDVRKLIDQN